MNMLLSIAVLFLLYAVRDAVEVPTVCFVLTWTAAVLYFLSLEFKIWRHFIAGTDRTDREGERE